MTVTEKNAPTASRIRVWWIPQMPMTPFKYDVPTLEAGAMLCDALARYDLFQYEHKVKPDYANAGGLEVLDDDGDWVSIDENDEYDMEAAREIIGAAVSS